MTANPQVADAIEAVHAAHRAAAAAHVTHARAVADARRQLAGILREQQPEQTPTVGFRTRLSDDDLAELRETADRLGLDPDRRWTAEQTVQVLRAVPASLAAALVDRWLEASSDARQCWELDHEGQIERMRGLLLASQQAHGCWNHTHPAVNLDA